MHPAGRSAWALGVAVALLGCQAVSVTRPGAKALRPAARPAGAVAAPTLSKPRGADLLDAGGQPLINLDGGSLINLDGGSLINLDGGSLVGQVELPAGMRGPGGYRLAQARPGAGVRVYLRDAAGRFLADAEGRLRVAVADAQGRFSFPFRATRGLSFYAPVRREGAAVYGLSALRPKDVPAGEALKVDGASSMLAGWARNAVLPFQDDPGASLDRLTRTVLNEALGVVDRSLGSGGVTTAGLPWQASTLGAAMQQAGQRDNVLRAALGRVRQVMTLAGVDTCEAGRRAADVPLLLPVAVAAVGRDLYVASHLTAGLGRIRAGKLEFVEGPCVRGQTLRMPSLDELVVAPGGAWVYGASGSGRSIWRLDPKAPGARPELYAGGGREPLAEGKAALSVALETVESVAVRPDGGLWLYTHPGRALGGKLISIGPDGQVLKVYDDPLDARYIAMAVTPDGALWVANRKGLWRIPADKPGLVANGSRIWEQPEGRPGETPAERSARGPELNRLFCALLPMPDNTVLVTVSDRAGVRLQHGIMRADADRPGELVRYAGGGPAGYDPTPVEAAAAAFNSPSGLARDDEGRVYVADYDNGAIRVVAGGRVFPFAGGPEAGVVVGTKAALSLPMGVAFDASGTVVVTEAGAHSLRRLEGSMLVQVAGGGAGQVGLKDPEPATRLNAPMSVTPVGSDLLLVELNERRLIRYSPATGQVVTVAGGGPQRFPDTGGDARQANFAGMLGLAVDPQGRPVFAASREGEKDYTIWRVEADGRLTRIGGSASGPEGEARIGQPLSAVKLGVVGGLAYDRAGTLYLSELQDARVWKVGADGRMQVAAGRGLAGTILQLASAADAVAAERDVPAAEATLLSPAGLAVDEAGGVYVAEFGIEGLSLFTQALGLDLGGQGDLPRLSGRLRRLTPEGRAVTVAGLGAPGQDPPVRNPLAVSVRGERVVFIDFGTGQVKELGRPR